MKKIFLCALFVLLVSSISVSAQNSAIDPAALLKNMPNLSTQVFKGMFADLAKQPPKSATKTQNNNDGTNNQTATPKNQSSTIISPADDKNTAGKTTFTPTSSFLMLKEFSKQLGKNEEERKKYEKLLTEGYTGYELGLKNRGLTRNDVARSASSLLNGCLKIYKDSELSDAQLAGIYRQTKEIFEANEDFLTSTNTERQKAYEVNIMLWALIHAYYFNAKQMNDPKIIKAVGDVTAVIFEVVTGESIKNVKVTDDGLKM
ncbi:MAG: DUF6683 family protein [Pyrinomonadaceae bacterium]